MRFVFIFFLCFLSGCSLWKHRNFKNPKADLASVTLKSSNFSGATLLFGVEIENPNDYPLELKGVNYEVFLADKKISEEKIENPVRVEKSSKTVIELPLSFKYSEVIGSIASFLKSTATPYRIAGSARFGLFNLKFDESGELSIENGEVKHQKKSD